MHLKLLRMCGFLLVAAYLIIFIFSCSIPSQSGADTSNTEEENSSEQQNSSGQNQTQDEPGGTRSFNANVSAWTLMFYLGGDNNLDGMLLANMSQLLRGYCGGMRPVILIDRSGSSNSVEPFGEAFATTRMYTITQHGFVRLYGDEIFPELDESNGDCELNTADASILKKFVGYSKQHFPADHYALIIGSHGGGVRTGNQNARAIVLDEESDKDWIFTAELTDVLTASESVDVLAFDACCMGSLEVAYQFCGTKDFKADYIVASPAEEWSFGWDYNRLAALFETNSPEPSAFAIELVNNYRNYIEANQNDSLQTLTCLRSSSIPLVKHKLDALAAELVSYKIAMESLRGKGRLKQKNVLHYFKSEVNTYWLQYPYFDLYSLAERISASEAFSETVRNAARELSSAIDEAVLCSYSGSGYTLAHTDVTGLSIFFPCGKEPFGYSGNTYWYYQYFYNALSAQSINPKCYGKLAFCADGATASNGAVENWFELLDYWFDDEKNRNGYAP